MSWPAARLTIAASVSVDVPNSPVGADASVSCVPLTVPVNGVELAQPPPEKLRVPDTGNCPSDCGMAACVSARVAVPAAMGGVVRYGFAVSGPAKMPVTGTISAPNAVEDAKVQVPPVIAIVPVSPVRDAPDPATVKAGGTTNCMDSVDPPKGTDFRVRLRLKSMLPDTVTTCWSGMPQVLGSDRFARRKIPETFEP